MLQCFHHVLDRQTFSAGSHKCIYVYTCIDTRMCTHTYIYTYIYICIYPCGSSGSLGHIFREDHHLLQVFRHRRLGGVSPLWHRQPGSRVSCLCLRCVRARDAARDQCVSRHVFVPAAPAAAPSPGRASRFCKTAVKLMFSEQVF